MTPSKQKGNISAFLLIVSVVLFAAVIAIGIIFMLPNGIKSGRYSNPNVATEVIQGTVYDRNGRTLSQQVSDENGFSRTYPASYHACQLIRETENLFSKYLDPRPGFNEAITYGKDIYLTIDFDIQYILDLAIQMAHKTGDNEESVAFIANAENGEILAISTYPFYDLNSNDNVGKNKALISNLTVGNKTVRTSVISKITDHEGNTVYSNDHFTKFGFTTDLDSTLAMLELKSTLYRIIPSEENPKYILFMGPYYDNSVLNLITNSLQKI